MHVCFLFPRFKLLSGAERLILKLAGALIDQGVTISIVCHQFDSSCEPILPKNAQLLISGRKLDYFSNRYANAAFDYFRPDSLVELILGNAEKVCCFGPGLTAIPLIKKKNIPAFYFCYEPPRFLYTDRELIQNKLGISGPITTPIFSMYKNRDQRFVAAADHVFSNSEFGRRQIQEIYGIDATVITHGLDPFIPGQRGAEIRKQFGIAESDVVAITVNYLHPRKRIDLFIETVQRVPQVHGLIVGDGPERDALKAKAGPNVHFAGFIPDEQLHEYYQCADLYLHTARLETFGLSVIEASGNKLPVVSVNEGGPCDTVRNGGTGFLTEATAESLSHAVSKLCEDAELRKSLGSKGFEYVRSKYTWKQGAQDFLDSAPLR